MNENKEFDLITIGESLIELSSNQTLKDSECLHKFYGGDSIVTAIAASRLNSRVGFISCIGDDPFKEFLLSSWDNEIIDTTNVRVVDAPNGLYMVSRKSINEKEFVYYRKKSASSQLSVEDIKEDYIKKTKIVYASGVTQSLSLNAREAVKKAFQIAKENNIITAYDPNFSRLISTPDDAKEYFEEIIPYTDILFMSAKNDNILFDTSSIDNISKYLADIGISVSVIKSSTDSGYFISNKGNITFVKFYYENVVDTTSSGDAFNGAFLHSIAQGYNPVEAAKIASIDAGLQAQGIGAVKSTPHYDEVYEIYKSEVI